MKVNELIHPDPIYLTSSSTIKDAARCFLSQGVDAAPVVDEQKKLLGVLTKTHCYQVLESGFINNTKITDLMTSSVETLQNGQDINVMDRWPRSCYPVVDNGHLVGTVYRSNIITARTQSLENTIDEMKTGLDAAYNMIISIDSEACIRIYNREAEKAFGIPQQEAVGKKYEEISPRGPLADILSLGTAQTGQKYELNGRTLVSNRTPIIKDGQVIGAISVAQDISDLENISRELDYTKKLIKSLDDVIQTSLDSIFVTDAQARVISVNKAYTKMTGIKAEEILGKSMYELVEKGYYNKAASIMVVESKQQASYIEKTSTGKTALFIGTPIYDSRGELVNVLVNIHDITELENVSTELSYIKELKNELDAIINASFDGILVTGADDTIITVNEAYERITNFSKEELLGKNSEDLIKAGYYDRTASTAVLETGQPATITQKLRDGKTLLVSGSPLFNRDGKVIRIISNVRDLTELNQLKAEVEHAHGLSRHYQEELKKITLRGSGNFIVESEKSLEILNLVVRLAKVDSTILIQGESGVGKEIVAHQIHENSLRHREPFISINCGALPETLLESELFGYEAGAFTGARREGKMGIFELAHGGTLFLDEIGDLPLAIQVKLLRALQEGEIIRVGGVKPKKIDVRILAATNRDLNEMVQAGTFREDLFYRINVIPIHVPPLRERKEEVPVFVMHFLQLFNKKYDLDKSIDEKLWDTLLDYEWPGNVRELKNVIEHAVVTSPDKTITELKLTAVGEPKLPSKDTIYFSLDKTITLKCALEDFEKQFLTLSLHKYKSSRKAAAALGVSQTTIWRKAHQYGIPLST